jgi:predicted metal-binding membrane protein
MASLFALGVLNLWWMVFVAAVIAVQKTVPWRQRIVTCATSTDLRGKTVPART